MREKKLKLRDLKLRVKVWKENRDVMDAEIVFACFVQLRKGWVFPDGETDHVFDSTLAAKKAVQSATYQGEEK